MKILIFHPVRLPPADYGGVERVVLWLSEALLERGHEVWVCARPGSQLSPGVRLLEMPEPLHSADDLLRLMPSGLDVVHFMAPPGDGIFARLPCAGLLTVHGNGKPGECYPPNTVFLSRDHATRHGRTRFVYNGVNPAEFMYSPTKAPGARPLFLSKTSWKVKNLGGAMRFCHRAGTGLTIAGGHRPFRYRALAPWWGQQWVGPVSGLKKAELLRDASCLVFPVLWPEPFGLVVIEAMMSGTPVFGPPIGSLPELISADTGAVISLADSDAWIERIRAAAQGARPEACRERALRQFSHHAMAEGYEAVYRETIQGELQP